MDCVSQRENLILLDGLWIVSHNEKTRSYLYTGLFQGGLTLAKYHDQFKERNPKG